MQERPHREYATPIDLDRYRKRWWDREWSRNRIETNIFFFFEGLMNIRIEWKNEGKERVSVSRSLNDKPIDKLFYLWSLKTA